VMSYFLGTLGYIFIFWRIIENQDSGWMLLWFANLIIYTLLICRTIWRSKKGWR
jgi:hypothetical protein